MMKHKSQKGVALYIAITVTGALVLVAFAVIQLAIRQIALSSAGRDSQEAFYAADSGGECALFWDVKNPTSPAKSAFGTTSPYQTISCNGDAANPSNTNLIPSHLNDPITGVGTTTFSLTFMPNPYCATISVVKSYIGSNPFTKIESRGYNTCDPTAFQRVERAIRINY